MPAGDFHSYPCNQCAQWHTTCAVNTYLNRALKAEKALKEAAALMHKTLPELEALMSDAVHWEIANFLAENNL